jgi:hypothetical protein
MWQEAKFKAALSLVASFESGKLEGPSILQMSMRGPFCFKIKPMQF